MDGINLNNPWYVQSANESISIGGIQYAIFSDACKTNITMCWTTVFNKDLVDDWNITNLYSLVKSGDWTMDKLIALTKDVYSDLNGDNVSDANDLYGYYTDSFATLDAFMISHGVQAVSKAKDDIPVLNFYSENLIRSFGKVYDLYWNNSATYVVTDKAYTYIKSFSDGHAMFSPMLIDYMLTDLRTMKDDYGILPYPKLDKEQNNYYTYLLSRPGMFMLPATVSNEKLGKVGYVVEALNAYSYKFLRPAIYDEALIGKGTRDEESFEMLDLIMNTRTYDFSGFNETAGGIGDFPFNPAKTYRSLLSKKNINITSYYEANKVAGNEYLSKLVKLYNP